MSIRRQKFIALAMVLVSAAALARVTQGMTYLVLVCLVCFFGLSDRFHFRLRPARRAILVLILGLIFAVKYRYFTPYVPLPYTNLRWQVPWTNVAQFFLAVMALQFFVLTREKLTTAMPLLGLVTFFCVAHISEHPDRDLVYQGLVLVFLALTVIFTASYRVDLAVHSLARPRARSALAAGVLAVALCAGWWAGRFTYTNLSDLDYRITALYMKLGGLSARTRFASELGFSESTELSSIRNLNMKNADRVALRVFSERTPGYLRAKVYEHFERSRWESRSETVSVLPIPDPNVHLPREGRGKLFPVVPQSGEDWYTFDVWPDPDIEIAVYAPLKMAYLRMPVDEIIVDDHAIADADQLRGGVNFHVFEPRDYTFSPPPDMVIERTLQIPEILDPSIQDLADAIFVDARTPAEKIAAVERYFRTNYEYQLGIQIPRGLDPMTYFLTEKPAAHCEYFATGAVLLLRLAGVPARYVTGFVCVEKSDWSEYWMARNRDAHAWAEAWDAQNQSWTLVEATPASGRPSAAEATASRFEYFLDYLKYLRQELRVAIYANGLQGAMEFTAQKIGAALTWLLTTPMGIPVTAAAVLLALRNFIARRLRGKPATDDPVLAHLLGLRSRMEKQLARAGLVRRPYETISEFLERLETAPAAAAHEPEIRDWYARYTRMRFGPRRDNAELDRLSDTLTRLKLKNPAGRLPA